MTTATKKYYVLVPAAFSHDGNFYWQELHDVKTLTQAQQYVNRVFGGLTEAEIWMSRDGVTIKVISKKSVEGEWKLVYSREEPDNHHYHLKNMRVSREAFFKYGFHHNRGMDLKN